MSQLKFQNKELLQYKLNYEDHKKKWMNKVSASAGDVVDQMNSLMKQK